MLLHLLTFVVPLACFLQVYSFPDKFEQLCECLKLVEGRSTLVFCATKGDADELCRMIALERDLRCRAVVIHGDKSQSVSSMQGLDG